MQAPSHAWKGGTSLPPSGPAEVPLVHLQLNHMLALTQWAAAFWLLGQNQFSRYTTFLAGGVPLDA